MKTFPLKVKSLFSFPGDGHGEEQPFVTDKAKGNESGYERNLYLYHVRACLNSLSTDGHFVFDVVGPCHIISCAGGERGSSTSGDTGQLTGQL